MSLIAYIVENHIEALRDITYVDTFVFLERHYEQEKNRLENPPSTANRYLFVIMLNNS